MWPFLWRVTIVFISIVISRVKQLILTLKFLNRFINILMNRFNPQLNLQCSENEIYCAPLNLGCHNFGGPCIYIYVLTFSINWIEQTACQYWRNSVKAGFFNLVCQYWRVIVKQQKDDNPIKTQHAKCEIKQIMVNQYWIMLVILSI